MEIDKLTNKPGFLPFKIQLFVTLSLIRIRIRIRIRIDPHRSALVWLPGSLDQEIRIHIKIKIWIRINCTAIPSLYEINFYPFSVPYVPMIIYDTGTNIRISGQVFEGFSNLKVKYELAVKIKNDMIIKHLYVRKKCF
jgi:hypothetical protein